MGNSCRGSVKSPPSSWDRDRDSSIHGEINASLLTSHPPHSHIDRDKWDHRHSIGLQLDATDEIDPIIDFIESRLYEIMAREEASTSTTSETVSYGSKMASEHILSSRNSGSRFLSTFQSEKYRNKEVRKVTMDVLKAAGEAHWVLMGLSVAAYALERFEKKSNVSECMEVLQRIVDLGKVVRAIREIMPVDCEILCKEAVGLVVEGAMVCCEYMEAKQNVSRKATARLRHLSKEIQESRNNLISSIINIAPVQVQSTLDSSAEGRELQEAKVKELLDMEGGEPAVAVTLCGLPGVGKSTLAASVVRQLQRTCTDFKFCTITVDENTPDKTAHIVKLQRDIIHDFTGREMVLRDADEGRKQLQEAIENQSCFLYIDNSTDTDYVRKMLPRQLSTGQQLEEKADSWKKLKQKPKLRILVSSRKSNLRDALNIKRYKEYAVNSLSSNAAKILLWNIILEDESKVHEHFDEAGLIDAVAEACKGVPILLSRFGNHLRLEREKCSYEAVLEALAQGNSFITAIGREDVLSKTLLLVYNVMREMAPETHEAFLDICTYFQGLEWDVVGYIVGREQLEALHRRMLVTKSDSDTVIVEDIYRAMGLKEAKGTRVTNYEELSDVLNDKSKLETIKGLALLSDKSSRRLESECLNAMHNSLRVLHLGNSVTLDGPPCDKPFINLRYLRVGDAVKFPLKDASKLDNLKLFLNASNTGMDCGQLPPSVKLIHYQVPDDMDGNAFARLQLENMKSLDWFRVKTRIHVELPQELELPASLKFLDLSSCKHVPKFSQLSALEHLALDHCDMKSLPQELGEQSKLKHLSVNYCKNVTSLSEGALGKLCELEELNLRECESFRALPPDMSGLSSLQSIELTGCISLQSLPDSFARLPIRSITFQSLVNLEMLPQSIGDLSCLKTLNLISCNSLTSLPDSFVQLEMLEKLRIESCTKLGALPRDFGQLSSLKEMIVENCPLKELPPGFQSLPALKMLSLIRCNSLVNLPERFGELTCLEELHLKELFISRLPHGFANLKNLKALRISEGYKLETLGDEFENLVNLSEVRLKFCRKLEATTMDIIGKLQHCFLLDIEKSAKLVERWNEMQRDEPYYPMAVIASSTLDDKEWQRAVRECLFHGKCIKLNESSDDLIEQSSLLVENGTTLAVIRLPNRIGARRKYLLQRLVAAEGEKLTASSGQLQVICARSVDLVRNRRGSEEEKSIRQMLNCLPEGSCAIFPSDTRLFALIQYLCFHVFGYYDDDQIGCLIVEVQPDDQDNQCFRSARVM